jgi:hypothetical protein
VATFASGTEDLQGEGAGFTYATGTFDYIYYDNDGMDCYQRYYTPTDYANVDVRDPDHVRVVLDDQGFPSNCFSTGIYVRQITVQQVNAYNEDVTASTSIKEDLTNISTNTCGNGSPTGGSCAPDDGAGRFTDQMAVSRNFCSSGISQNSGCGYTLTSNWSWCGGGTPLSIWTYNGETRSNVVKVNGRTASYDTGTFLYGTGGPPVP